MITCYRITIFIHWSLLSSRIMMYHVIGNGCQSWVGLHKSNPVTGVLHHQFILGIQWYPTISNSLNLVVSYHILSNSTHSHSVEWNQVSRCCLRWTWAENTTKSAGGLKYLWLIISAADVPGLLGREVSLCHCALFKQIVFYEILCGLTVYLHP